jgi:hypothetical protein
VAPGGAARLMSMSRDGPASPVPAPASAAAAAANSGGSQPVATSSSSKAAADIASAIVLSSRCSRATTNPPATMPAAPHSM